MSTHPQYALSPGTEITLHGAAHQVLAAEAQGYRTVEVETNCETFIPFGRFVEVLKLPGTRIELPPPMR